MKNRSLIIAITVAAAVFIPGDMWSQSLSYEQFMDAVAQNNAGYLAEKYNVDIAVANLQASKVFNDPELSIDYGNNQDKVMQMGQSLEVGLSYDLGISGERRARISAAKSEKELSEASVRSYFSALKLEAAEAWAEAWRLKRSCEIMKDSVDDMMKIAKGDSLRAKIGDIGRTDATQSRLEAQTLRGDLLALQAEYRNALMQLGYLAGGETISDIAGDVLPQRSLPYSMDDLVDMAHSNRADLKAAELSHTLSEDNLRIVKASRAFDIGLNLGYSHNTEVRNEIAPAPMFNGVTVGVSIPLKFSSFNRGEIKAARQMVEQSQKYYMDAIQQVTTETAQAYNSLQAAKEVLSQYDSGMLDDARAILDSRQAGYTKGESSLLELLTAQQTYRDVMQSYVDACADCFVSQAKLEFSVGYEEAEHR